jgi:predicted lipid-binding transport protein (Tim44 family)
MKRSILALISLGLASPALAQSAEGPPPSLGVLDIILVAVAVYFLWRLITRLRGGDRNPQQGPPTYDANPDEPEGQDKADQNRQARAKTAWEYLAGDRGNEAPEPAQDQADQPGQPTESGFDQAEFIRGAKAMYARIKQAWAKRDLEDLRQFASPGMMNDFERMSKQHPETEDIFILRVEAKVQNVRTVGGETQVEVQYQAAVSSDPKSREPRNEQEVWLYTKDEERPGSHWLLASMERPQ